MTGLGPDMSQAELLRLAGNPSGVADLLSKEHPETGDSPAEIMADIINVMRADNKTLAAALGVEQNVSRMTPERAAQLLAGTINGSGVELVIVFNEVAQQRDEILRKALDEEPYESYIKAKHGMMFTEPAEANE